MRHAMLADIFLFNATCETAIANNSPFFVPKKRLLQFEDDLSYLPLVFAKEKDIVLTNGIENKQFENTLKEAGFQLPMFKSKKEALDSKEFVETPKNALKPWGWSPLAHHELNKLKASCSPTFLQLPEAYWNDKQRAIYSRKTALKVLSSLIKTTNNSYYQQVEELPVVCQTEEEVMKQYEKHKNIFVKAPWSSSGRGLLPLVPGEVRSFHSQKIKTIIDKQGYIMAEPIFNKVLDFSFHYKTSPDKDIEFLGNTWFDTGAKGQYVSNLLGMPKTLTTNSAYQFLRPLLDEINTELKECINTSDIKANYSGILGVDAFVYLNSNNEYRINPCVEINCRYTMGMVSLALNKIIAPNSSGAFHIFYENNNSYEAFCKEQQAQHPLIVDNQQPVSGFLPLCPPCPEAKSGAYILLNK